MSAPRDDLPFFECRWLERAAHDPKCPIEFDSDLNEYSLKTTHPGSMSIYHCPFCSGRAPQSLRSQMFATIPDEETIRLHLLTKDLKTEEDVLSSLGVPTHILEPGATVMDAEKDGEPREVRATKSLRYEGLSDTATLNVNVSRYGKIRISFSGKFIGKPKPA